MIKNKHLKRLVNTWFSCGGGILKDIPLPWKKQKQVFLIISSNYLQPVSLAFSRCGWFSMFPQLGLAVTSTKPLLCDSNRHKWDQRKWTKKKNLKFLSLFNLDSFSQTSNEQQPVRGSAMTGPCCEATHRSDPKSCRNSAKFPQKPDEVSDFWLNVYKLMC